MTLEYKVVAYYASDFTGENFLINTGFEYFDDADSFFMDQIDIYQNNYDSEIIISMMEGERTVKSYIVNEVEPEENE